MYTCEPPLTYYLTLISTHLPSEFTLPLRYLWNPCTIFFVACGILVQVTCLCHPHSCLLSLHQTQSTLLNVSVIVLSVTTFSSPVQWLSVRAIFSPPHSWFLSSKCFGLWFFSPLLLSTLPFMPTSTFLEYSYILQTDTECLLYVHCVLGTSDVSMGTTIKMPCCHRA